MDATQQARVAVLPTHLSSRRRGPFELIGEAARDVFSRRRLIGYLARADLKKKGTDTLFGNLWWVLDPLLQMVIYSVLVTIIFARTQPAYPLFIFAAILPWKWFANSASDAVVAISGQDKLIKQIQFPKLVLPLSIMLGNIGQFAFGLIPLAALLLFFYPDRISVQVAWIPVIAAVQFVFTLAFGIVLSAINVFLRDVNNLSRHVLRLWFYLSPALYGRESLLAATRDHPTLTTAMQLNPFYTILEAYRGAIYRAEAPDLRSLALVLAASVVFLVLALMFFKRLEPNFAKVL